MIVYSLRCARDHAFEAWFASIVAFDEQSAHGKLVCPLCNSRKVTKAPMAPAVSTGSGKAEAESAAPSGAPQTPPHSRGPEPNELRKMRQFMTGLRKYVEENAEYVGAKFPEEARKIHYGETEHRRIYGEASLGEAAELVEEGIDVAPLPPDMDEMN